MWQAHKMMRKLKQILGFTCLLLLVSGLVVLVWLRSTDATAADFRSFKRGDIIFQTSRSGQSLAILLASKSPYSHMGIIDFDDSGNPVVLEATATTRATPLHSWVKRGLGERISVFRLPTLTESEASAVSRDARKHFGKKYDPFFYSTDDELYCSELVFLAFKSGINLELGRYQKVNTLALDNFAVRKVIKSRWNKFPLCANGQAKDFESCFAIIQQQFLITPQSIAEDKRLLQVFNNYGNLAGH
jgi:hypothetical protein